MRRLFSFVSNNQFKVIAVLLAVSAFFFFSIFDVRKGEDGYSIHAKIGTDTSAEGMMAASNDGIDDGIGYYNDVRSIFGSDNIIVIKISDEKLFTPDKLGFVEDLAYSLQDMPCVTKVQSLFNVKNFKGRDGMLETEPFFGYVPDTQEEIDQVKKDAMNNRTVYRNLISKDGSSMALTIYIAGDQKDRNFVEKITNSIEAEIDKIRGNFSSIYQIGMPFAKTKLSTGIIDDSKILSPLAVVVLLCSLIVCSRNLNGAIIPVITSSISLLWTIGFMCICGYSVTVLSAIVPALIIVIGSTEDIHIISEFHEGMLEHDDRKSAINYIGGKIGTALFLTFFTTFFGFFSIYFNDIRILKEFGMISAFALLANFLTTITVNPLYLSYFGKRPKAAQHSEECSGVFKTICNFFISIIKYKRRYIVFFTIIISVTMLVGITRIKVNNDLLGYFKDDSEVSKRSENLADEFCGILSFYVVLKADIEDSFKKSEYLKQIVKIQDYLRSRKDADGKNLYDTSVSFADYISIINREMHDGKKEFDCIPENDSLVSQYCLFLARDDIEKYMSPDFSTANILVRHNIAGSYFLLEEMGDFRRFINENIVGVHVGITGENILINEASDSMAQGQVVSLLVLSFVVFCIMSLLFTDVKAGILSLIPNLFPVMILFGVMGYAGIYLDTGTAMIGAIAVGIAMDDTIHFMVRYQKEMRETGDQVTAMEKTMQAEIVPVFSTSIATSLGFAILLFSSFKPIENFGILTGVTMMCALCTDLLITPMLLISTRLITLWDMLSLELKGDVINKSPLFRNMRKWEIKKTILIGDVQTYEAGQKIISQGEIGREMFLLLDGQISVSVNSHDGTTKHITKLNEGDVFGEVGLVSEQERTADIIAETSTKVLKLEWESLERIGKFLPTISSKLFLNIAKILGSRFAISGNK